MTAGAVVVLIYCELWMGNKMTKQWYWHPDTGWIYTDFPYRKKQSDAMLDVIKQLMALEGFEFREPTK